MYVEQGLTKAIFFPHEKQIILGHRPFDIPSESRHIAWSNFERMT